jgi:hypothetical protein
MPASPSIDRSAQADRDDGVSRVVVSLDSAKGDKILPDLDRWANLIRRLGS